MQLGCSENPDEPTSEITGYSLWNSLTAFWLVFRCLTAKTLSCVSCLPSPPTETPSQPSNPTLPDPNVINSFLQPYPVLYLLSAPAEGRSYWRVASRSANGAAPTDLHPLPSVPLSALTLDHDTGVAYTIGLHTYGATSTIFRRAAEHDYYLAYLLPRKKRFRNIGHRLVKSLPDS